MKKRKSTTPGRFVITVILLGIAVLVILVCVCMPELPGIVLNSHSGLVGVVVGVTIGILVGYLFHYAKTTPVIRKLSKKLNKICSERDFYKGNFNALYKEFKEVDAELNRFKIAQIAYRNNGAVSSPDAEALSSQTDDEE